MEKRKGGLYKKYYKSGELWEKGNYKNGKTEGLVKCYYVSGAYIMKQIIKMTKKKA